MNPLLRVRASQPAVWALPLLTGLLASCGGGGPPAPTLSGEVHGLAPTLPGEPNSGKLRLTVNGQPETFSTGTYVDKIAITFARSFAPGESYSIAVEQHPEGQVCVVTRAASGKLDASISDLRVDCHTTRLNDTGVAGVLTAEITARAPDSQSGRDAEHGRLTKRGSGAFGFDFTRICPTGVKADAFGGCPSGVVWAAATDSCVLDNVTGLMWRRADVAYDGTKPDPGNRLCGLANWRAPTVHELLSIVHAGRSAAPYVDTDFFGATSGQYFTGEIYQDPLANERWMVDLSNAGVAVKYSPGLGGEQRRALWVSGSSALDDPDSSAYTRRDAGTSYTIIDTQRELMWLVPKVVTEGDWPTAVASVDAIRSSAPGGYGDWRLPNRSELDTLVNRKLLDRSPANPAMDPEVRQAIPNPLAASVIFWTSSILVTDPSQQAWVIDFAYGDVTPAFKSSSARLIYVRNRVFNPEPTLP